MFTRIPALLIVAAGAFGPQQTPAQPFPDKRITFYVGIGRPKGMDPKVVAILHDAFRTALEDPEYLRTLDRREMNVVHLSSADYVRWARERYAQEKRAVERPGLKR